ncbi:lysophospholipid acyltransferase family protein [Candidatus Pseudothioglobus singularis]|jgi:Kdo2-lipid IVA lauroyltransferase/acyltransferase|nr:lysophospholipid acyltransferase family protein [Candidatus Pseudothioglobus singularis]
MIRLFLAFCSLMPLKVNHLFGSFIGYLLYLFNSDAKSVSKQNLEICFPDLSKDAHKILLKNVLIETGKGLTESGLIWNQKFKDNAKLIRNINGEHFLDNSNKTILLVPHMGCWEITGRVLATRRRVTFMFKRLRSNKQNDYLFARRNHGNLTMASADKSGILKIQRALNNGDLVGMLPDQDPGQDGGLMVPFFGKKVNTMTLLARIAKKHNAQVLMFWALRLDNGKGYDLNIEPINLSANGNHLEARVGQMNQSIESLILKHPEQYMWSYKRFKSSHFYI